jgi:hypothetical protein
MPKVEATQDQYVEEMNKVLERINAGEITYVDNHDGVTKTLEGYIILDECIICPLFVKAQAFSLNPLYVSKNDNKVHVATPSIGPTVARVYHDDDLLKAIEATKNLAISNNKKFNSSSFRVITKHVIF